MKPDSRGIIIAIEAVLVAGSIVASGQGIKAIQNANINAPDDGSSVCYTVYAIILTVYWVIVLIYTAINYKQEKIKKKIILDQNAHN